MYTKDNQGAVIVLIALTLLLACAIALQWETVMITAAVGLTVVLVHLLSSIQQRLRQLERVIDPRALANDGFSQQRMIIYSTALLALFAYANTWMWLAGGALLVLFLCLIHTISNFQTRLFNLEKASASSIQVISPVSDQSIDLNENLSSKVSAQPSSLASHSDDLLKSNQASAVLSWLKPVFDWVIHGNPILRVAVMVLMVGVILLLRFASEHWQLSLGAKLGFIAMIGGAITGFGYFLRKKNDSFAVALQGIGLAIIFLTLLFSHHYLVIASLFLASVICAMLLIATVILSLKQDSLYLAILALGMAYCAPLVIPQQQPDVIFLFSYYWVINLAVAAINYFKTWKILNHLAFFATIFIGGGAISVYAQSEQHQVLDILLWLHLALFIALSVRYSQLLSLSQLENQWIPTRLQPILDVGLIFSVPVFGFSLHAVLMNDSTWAMTMGAVFLAVIYAALAWWIAKKQSRLAVLGKSFFILAVAFTALIFPLAQGAHWSAVGWVIQGAALIVWGVTERERISRYVGVVLVLLSSIALLQQILSNAHFPILSTSIYALAQFVSAFYLLQYNHHVQKYFSSTMVSGLFIGLGMFAGSIAVAEYFGWENIGISPYLLVAVLLLYVFHFLLQLKAKVQWSHLQIVLASTLLILFYAEAIFSNLFQFVLWKSFTQQVCFVLAITLLMVFLHQIKATKQWQQRLHACCLLLGLALIGLGMFPNMGVSILAIAPILYAVFTWKTDEHSQWMHEPMVWALALAWLVWTCFDVSAMDGYLFPLFNFSDVFSIVVTLGLMWLIYHHTFDGNQGLEWAIKVMTITVALLVLSSVMVRALHYLIGTPLWSNEIWQNGIVQLSLTGLWLILAFLLMTFSSRRFIRQLWFIGAALLGVVVFKLLLLDLSQTATLTRVISFIMSGVVMLVIAYLAPLPPLQQPTLKDG